MKLLVITQAVDLDDPVLSFFHRWLEEFAKRWEHVHVICLKEGEHNLPKNVFVHSLGKSAQGRPASGWKRLRLRIRYVLQFYKYIWQLRNEYDAVFVHMNQEYVLFGWKLWFLLGKRVILWRNHKTGSLLTRIACLLSNTVCHTSPSAYVASFRNAVQMPIGIDTGVFKPSATPAPKGTILFLGRLDAVKRPEMLLKALGVLTKEGMEFTADIVGDPTPGREEFARELKKQFSSVPNVAFMPGIRNSETVAAYNSHAIYVNLTPSGSFDKTIGEAFASGCIVVAGNEAVREVVPDELLVDVDSAESVAEGIKFALLMEGQSREALSQKLRAYVVENHSLALLTLRLFGLYQPATRKHKV